MTEKYFIIKESDPKRIEALEAHKGYQGQLAVICNNCTNQFYGFPGKICEQEGYTGNTNYCEKFTIIHSLLH